MSHDSNSAISAKAQPIGFTRVTQRKLTAMRIIAYSLASLFMAVMVARGIAITHQQMNAEADRAVQRVAAMVEGMQKAGELDPALAQRMFLAQSPEGVKFRLQEFAVGTVPTLNPVPSAGNVDYRTVKIADGPWMLVVRVDNRAIWQQALDANFPFILFVLALGLPTIAIFLYMGWLVNRPALQLLAFAQAGMDENSSPPKLPKLWGSVLARLKQLRDNQSQMQAFLDNAPIGMMFRSPDGQLVMVNRYGASFYDQSPEELTNKPISFFNDYFKDSASLAAPLFLDPLKRSEITSVETEFHAPSGEKMDLLIK